MSDQSEKRFKTQITRDVQARLTGAEMFFELGHLPHWTANEILLFSSALALSSSDRQGKGQN